MKFEDLKIGEHFRFREGQRLRTKVSKREFSVDDEIGLAMANAKVLPLHEDLLAARLPATPELQPPRGREITLESCE
jgi:hypothetical protein